MRKLTDFKTGTFKTRLCFTLGQHEKCKREVRMPNDRMSKVEIDQNAKIDQNVEINQNVEIDQNVKSAIFTSKV